MDDGARLEKRWCEMDREEKLQYQRDSGARHRAKKKNLKPVRQLIDTPAAAARRDAARLKYATKKRQDEAATLQSGREHQRLLRLKRDGGPIGRLMKNVIKNVLQPYKKVDQNAARRLYHNTYRRKRYSEDDVYRFRCRLRVRLVTYLRTTGNPVVKDSSTFDMLGKTPTDVLDHLEQTSQMEVSTSEIDHVFALAAYNLSVVTNTEKVMHWSNLQLLTPEENKSKNDKLPTKAMAAKVDPSCWPDGITMDMLPDIYPGWSTALRM